MPLETVTRCSHCKHETCDGKMYRAEYVDRYTNRKIKVKLCSRQIRDAYEHGGKKYYHVIYGHGDNEDVEIRAEDEPIITATQDKKKSGCRVRQKQVNFISVE